MTHVVLDKRALNSHPCVLMRTTVCLLSAFSVAVSAQQPPAVHLIANASATSKQMLGFAAAVRELPGGRVLVNDITKRQLVMLDPSLAVATIVADSASGGANAYGPSAGAIIGYQGDSTLFIDPRDLSMFVIGPAGNIARVAAVPRSQDAAMMGSNVVGSPAVDAKGRLVYRAGFPRMMSRMDHGGTMAPPEFPDSAAIVRVDLASRKVDTAAYYKIAKLKMVVAQSEKGISMTTEINPMPIVDDWGVMADGSVAIVRGRDYHVDWLNPDDVMSASPKIPFDWQRLTDEDKVATLDSAKAQMERSRANPSASAGEPPGNRVMINMSVSGDGAARSVTTAAGAAPAMNFVSPSELPDYRPAFSQGAVKPDLDNNLWIRTSSTRSGSLAGPIYDVLNRRGELVDRVQVPAGRTIVGFGKGGTVYMMARDDHGGWIEKTHR